MQPNPLEERATHLASLWVWNDSGIYEAIRETIAEHHDDPDCVGMVMEQMQDFTGIEVASESLGGSLPSDLLNLAVAMVDWRRLAWEYIDDWTDQHCPKCHTETERETIETEPGKPNIVDVCPENGGCGWGQCDPECPGWFENNETGEVERCDECARFPDDDDARGYALRHGWKQA